MSPECLCTCPGIFAFSLANWWVFLIDPCNSVHFWPAQFPYIVNFQHVFSFANQCEIRHFVAVYLSAISAHEWYLHGRLQLKREVHPQSVLVLAWLSHSIFCAVLLKSHYQRYLKFWRCSHSVTLLPFDQSIPGISGADRRHRWVSQKECLIEIPQ